MPLTVQFGPWAPDQSENPIQFYDQPGPLMVPCADCLNVIYSNGNYRNIASPSTASIDGNAIQPLGVSPVSAFSYFDTVEQQETVFAGTAAGVQQLNADGTWSQIALITNQSAALAGLSMSMTTGNFANALTPRGQRIMSATGVLVPFISGISFVAANRNVARANIDFYGFSSLSPPFGTLVSQGVSFGTVNQIYDNASTGASVFAVISASNPTQSAFTTIKANGKSFASSSATYSYSASLQQATWSFPARFGFAAGSTYQVVVS